MNAEDSKMRETDVAYTDQLFRLIQFLAPHILKQSNK